MKTHSFDPVSFFSGLVITAFGLIFLIPNAPSDIFDALGRLGAWFWPVLLLVIGAGILLPVFTKAGEAEDGDQSSAAG